LEHGFLYILKKKMTMTMRGSLDELAPRFNPAGHDPV
jgi:hypothetical protein